MTPKERIKNAVTGKPVDRIPSQINYTEKMGKKLADYFQIEIENLPRFLGNHILRVNIANSDRIDPENHLRYDWWGVGFNTEEEGYFIGHHPIAMQRDLDAFEWPDPDGHGLMDAAIEKITKDQEEHFIVPDFGFALFERAWTLRGLNAFLMDMVQDPRFVEEILDRITDIQLVLIDRFLQTGVDGAYFGDDYGAQKNLLFSPKMWRNYGAG